MRLRKTIFIFCIMLLTVMFANGAFVIYNYGWFGPGRARTDLPKTQKLHAESSMSQNPPINLMILGLDDERTRADVILLVNFDPVTAGLNLLSIARDTKVFARGRYSKINALYSAGKERLVADELRDITGLPVQYYLTMNFIGFRKVIDELDGVMFDVPFNMDYDDPTQGLHIHLDKGFQRLDGDASEQLVRYRKGNRSGEGYTDGDIGRIEMQQDFLKALISQKLSLRYLNKADDVFGILAKYMRMNFTISDFTHYLADIRRIKPENVKTFTEPGTSKIEGGAWYYIADAQKLKNIIDNNFYK